MDNEKAPALIPAFANPNFQKNLDRAEYKGADPCPCCGKEVKAGPTQPWLEVVYLKAATGAFFRTDDMTEDQIADTHGCFPVGPTCLRKLKKAGPLVITFFED